MTNLPFHYAPIRACLSGPVSDSRTIAVLVVPLDGVPLLARAALPALPDRDAVEAGCDELYAEAVAAAERCAQHPRALMDWWVSRAACTADGVYLAMPMSGAAPDPQAAAAALLAQRTG